MKTVQDAIDWANRGEPPEIYISGHPKRTQKALLIFAAEVARLKEENAELDAEVKHWKANHADLKNRLAFVNQRPDLPVDRIPAYEKMDAEIKELTKKGEDLCCAYGTALIEIHDLKTQLANHRKALAKTGCNDLFCYEFHSNCFKCEASTLCKNNRSTS